LSGDMEKDYSALHRALSEWTEVPEDLPFGHPRPEPTMATA
jgi:hypothetical protein